MQDDPRGTFLPQHGWVSHLLAAYRADWRSAIWFLTEQLERIWISGNLKLCYDSCGHIRCREDCMNWRQRGKEKCQTPWQWPFRGQPSFRDLMGWPFQRALCCLGLIPVQVFSTQSLWMLSLLSVEVIDRIPLSFWSSAQLCECIGHTDT